MKYFGHAQNSGTTVLCSYVNAFYFHPSMCYCMQLVATNYSWDKTSIATCTHAWSCFTNPGLQLSWNDHLKFTLTDLPLATIEFLTIHKICSAPSTECLWRPCTDNGNNNIILMYWCTVHWWTIKGNMCSEYWKTDRIVTLGLFHFIGPADSYTYTLPAHCCTSWQA